MNMFGVGNIGERLMSRFFREVDNVVWDLMTGKIGVRTADNRIIGIEGEGDDATTTDNAFGETGAPIPAFAQATPVSNVKVGDLIYNNKKVLGWITHLPNPGTGKGKATKTFKILKPDGMRGEWSPAKVTTFGLDVGGPMVCRSLFNMLPGGDISGLQGSLMPLFMFGDKLGLGGEGGGLKKMLPMLLMSQMGMGGLGGTAGAPAANPMGQMLPMMMMMQMMGGSGAGTGPGTGSKTGGYFD